jgi:AcrR family transcriptional regulator
MLGADPAVMSMAGYLGRVRLVAEVAPTKEVRPRNVTATKQLLLTAATEEFAAHGLAGARIDRIAERAGANKRLLYVYFGNKEQLFDAVVDRYVNELNDAVPMDPRDLGAYAGAVFDHLVGNPQAVRLVAWRDFERAFPTDAEATAYAKKLAALRAAQRAGKLYDGMSAIDMLAITQRIITSWLGATVGLKAAAGKDPMSARRLKQHRQALVDAVRRITDPH